MSEEEPHRILLVDDEVNITKALHRLLRKENWQIESCESGAEALKVLGEAGSPFSLIISDQRMPEMSGAEFLEKAAEISPRAVRFLLTGYSDLQAVVDAVNKGKIQRYLTKPWNDDALLMHVKQAIEEVEIRRENERLTLLTKKQNRQLYELGVTLEKRIQDRTHQLNEKNVELEALNQKLEQSFITTIRMLFSLVETADRLMSRYLRHVGWLSKEIAARMKLSKEEIEKIEMAGLLHDIGMLGLPEGCMNQSEEDLFGMELQRYRMHPAAAAAMLGSVGKLTEISLLVLQHHERYDGTGFPKGLKGEEIALGSRIIAATSDYCRILCYWPKNIPDIVKKAKEMHGLHLNTGISDVDALLRDTAEKILILGTRKKYDSSVVAALIEVNRETAYGG